ncbi:hypothetical protein INF30_05660 [Lachnospiraceae bacterium DSM 108991]|uniref:Uncharacterized protein n=1 Tax=Claveliimonas monacensis TaxID=2779351 RepID=A0ABR9RIF2_9FIRM|nr:hypothetical protein [Claveliimonas monacensis]MBE5062744.1 hypothetical protein [Claveliimonas monacensis]
MKQRRYCAVRYENVEPLLQTIGKKGVLEIKKQPISILVINNGKWRQVVFGAKDKNIF